LNQFGCDSTITLNLTIVYAGVNNIESIYGVKIYPNPSIEGKYQIQYLNEFNCQKVAIFNSQGMVIRQFNSLPETLELVTEESGTYYVEFQCEGHFYVMQVIKL
jgi:hypothetical protein